jgi:cytochrome c553
MTRLTLPLLTTLSLVLLHHSHAADFARDIQPLLAKHCLECHGPDQQKSSFRLDLKQAALKGGDNGPAILPADSSRSPLIQHISAPASDEMAMPPKGPRLSDTAIQQLRQWIDQGAPWPDALAGSDPRLQHWSVQPIPPTHPPPTELDSTHPIDAFIAEKLKAHKLTTAPQAAPRTLIRRLYFTLTGLPPSPEAVTQFIENPNLDTAYESLVDQLLASPHYGERWAQHWLDIAHYADTHGFERDQLRPNAWRYRDYVIAALNADKPYDQFLREQLAGDTLEPPVIPALGFLAAGPWDFVGQVETKSDVLRRAARAGDLDDIVSQVMTSTMAITMNCARCHDHKLDPITQREYFQLCSIFAGVKRADREADPTAAQQVAKQKQELQTQLDQASQQLAQFTGQGLTLASLLPPNSGIDLRTGSIITKPLSYHRNLPSNRRIPVPSIPAIRAVFVPNGPAPIPTTSGHAWDSIANRPLNAQHSTSLNGTDFTTKGHSLLAMHANSAITFDLAVIRQSTGPNALRLTGNLGFGANPAAIASKADFTVLVDGQLQFQKLQLQKNHTLALDLEIPSQAAELTLIATDGQDGISHDLLFIGDARLDPVVVPKNLSPADLAQVAQLKSRIATLQAKLKALPQPDLIYAFTSETQPPTIKIQRRGNPEEETEPVQPAAFTWTQHAPITFGDDSTPEHLRRRRLADWITHPDNPLTARVIVNRLWHHHFGQGLVTTPSDFGLGGDKPSHPELLDFLAHELMTRGWSLKHLHKLIVMSKTYRQESGFGFSRNDAAKAAATLDSANRLLWRQNPRRLDAETLRDTVLAVSGQLNLHPGGPGYRDFQYTEAYAPIYDYITPQSPDLWRRSIYRFRVRTTPHAFLTTLDCPDPANFNPARAQTTTALQALALSNNEFMLQQARYLAQRVQKESQDPTTAITRAFQLCFHRTPSQQELAAASGLDLFSLCRTLLNANELLYVD